MVHDQRDIPRLVTGLQCGAELLKTNEHCVGGNGVFKLLTMLDFLGKAVNGVV